MEKKGRLRRIWLKIRCRVLKMHDVDLRQVGPWMQVYCQDCEEVLTSYIPGN